MYTRTTNASRREARAESVHYAHVSCQAYMIENPKIALGQIVPVNQKLIPFIGRGTTYKVGRNRIKRAGGTHRQQKRARMAILRSAW